jgi:hypothetical protein
MTAPSPDEASPPLAVPATSPSTSATNRVRSATAFLQWLSEAARSVS